MPAGSSITAIRQTGVENVAGLTVVPLARSVVTKASRLDIETDPADGIWAGAEAFRKRLEGSAIDKY